MDPPMMNRWRPGGGEDPPSSSSKPSLFPIDEEVSYHNSGDHITNRPISGVTISELRTKRVSFMMSGLCSSAVAPRNHAMENAGQPLLPPPANTDEWPDDEFHENNGRIGITTNNYPKRHRTAMKLMIFQGVVGALFFLDGRSPEKYSGRFLKSSTRNNLNFDDLMAKIESGGDYSVEDKKRILAVAKTRWPECIQGNKSVDQCKTLIDQEVLDLNTENDRFIRTIIVGKRNEDDDLSNAIVVPMGDDDRVIGRDGDGLIYYDFDWNSTGVEATRYQQRKIPPIVAEEVTVDATYDSIIEYIKPVRILGATTDDAINGYSTDLIYGGVQIVPTAQNTPSGDIVLATALAEPTLIAEAGTRSLGPFDCTGLTGKNCCLMIKHKVRDSNVNGRAIQCYLDYADGTIKHESHLNARGKKVFIFENHRGRISKEPKVVGDWPTGVSNFHDWILDAGGLSHGQMKLIDPNWEPPGQSPN